MRAVVVAVSYALGQYLVEMSAPEDEEPISALSANNAHESLGERVRSWCSNGCLDGPDPLRLKHLVKVRRELRVSVPNEERGCARSACEIEAQIASLLDNPLAHWMEVIPQRWILRVSISMKNST
jgi:hypothetical protein